MQLKVWKFNIRILIVVLLREKNGHVIFFFSIGYEKNPAFFRLHKKINSEIIGYMFMQKAWNTKAANYRHKILTHPASVQSYTD